MEYWSIGVLEYWSIGVLEYWDRTYNFKDKRIISTHWIPFSMTSSS
jgi:hypothetical protein